MDRKTHFIISAVALAVALPLPPIKGGVPAFVFAVCAVCDMFGSRPTAGSVLLLLLAAMGVGVAAGIAAAMTWASWKLWPAVTPWVSLAILLVGLAYLMTRPIYDGGGWLDPVPSKTFIQMLKTGI